jgi:general secretion pathway protein M
MRLFDAVRELWQGMDSRTRVRSGYVLIALLAAALAWSALAGRVAVLEKKRTARETVVKELLPLKLAYRTAKQSSDQLTGRLSSLRPDDTIAKIIEEIGIRGRGVKISPLKGEERNGILEDAADVRIEGLTLNEAVNLVYRLEKGSRPLVMKKCNLRIRFDDPSRCDMAMILTLLRPAPGQPR